MPDSTHFDLGINDRQLSRDPANPGRLPNQSLWDTAVQQAAVIAPTLDPGQKSSLVVALLKAVAEEKDPAMRDELLRIITALGSPGNAPPARKTSTGGSVPPAQAPDNSVDLAVQQAKVAAPGMAPAERDDLIAALLAAAVEVKDPKQREALLRIVEALGGPKADTAPGAEQPRKPNNKAGAALPPGKPPVDSAPPGNEPPPGRVKHGAEPPGAAPSTNPPTTSAGSGPNSMTITNTSDHDQKIGMFMNGGSTTQPVAEITLKPGQTGTLSFQNGQGGFMAQSNSTGAYQPDASRLEFYADPSGRNNTNVSYIDGRNAAISVSDNHGKTIGDTKSIADQAPAGLVTKDRAGNPTIAGWYDGSTKRMLDGGAFMENQLGTGGGYIHPNDDRNSAPGTNPMTMANNPSQNYNVTFGSA